MKKPPDLIILLSPLKPIRSMTVPICFNGLQCSFSAFCSSTALLFYEFSRPSMSPSKPSLFVCRSIALSCKHRGSRLNLHDSQSLFSDVGTRSRFSLATVKCGTTNCIVSLQTLKPFQFWGVMEPTMSVKFAIFAHEIVIKQIITTWGLLWMNKVAPFLLCGVQCVDYVPMLLSIDLFTGVRTILDLIVVKEVALVELRSSNTSLAVCFLSHVLLYFWLHKSYLQLVKLVDDGSSYTLMFFDSISHSMEIDFSLAFYLLYSYDHLLLAPAYVFLVLWKIKRRAFYRIGSFMNMFWWYSVTTNAHNPECVNLVHYDMNWINHCLQRVLFEMVWFCPSVFSFLAAVYWCKVFLAGTGCWSLCFSLCVWLELTNSFQVCRGLVRCAYITHAFLQGQLVILFFWIVNVSQRHSCILLSCILQKKDGWVNWHF